MKLRMIREAKSIGLNQLANKVGVTGTYLSYLERGLRNNPSKEVMEKIAEALNETVPSIFYPEEVV